jgi:hypothetical protein
MEFGLDLVLLPRLQKVSQSKSLQASELREVTNLRYNFIPNSQLSEDKRRFYYKNDCTDLHKWRQKLVYHRRKIRLVVPMQNVVVYLKKLTCKGTLRQVFICLRPRVPHTPPPNTVYVYKVYCTYSHGGEGGQGGRVEPERWLEGQQYTKLGRKYQHD